MSLQIYGLACLALLTLAACGQREGTSPNRVPAATDQETLAKSASPQLPHPGEKPYWPGWRGPNADGIAREAISADWPATGLKQIWEAEIGLGFSSFAIADGRLYAMGWQNDRETVYCLDPLTGQRQWTHSYAGNKVDNLHDGGPGATPTVANGRVYTLGREGQFYCLQPSDGAVIWQKDLTKEAGIDVPEWGFTSSPLMHDGLVIVDAGRVMAFEAKTGERRWQTEKFRPGYGSAVAFERAGQKLIAVLNNDCLLVVSATDGQEVARFPWQTQYATTSTTPIVSGDTIFISSGYQRGCALVKWAGNQLEAFYENKGISNHFNNSVLSSGHLYGIDGNTHNRRLGQIVCLDHATGVVKWSHRNYGVGSLLIAGDKCLVLSDDGLLVACKATPEGYVELAKTRILDGLCWTVPVLADGKLYARNAAGHLVCVALPQ